MVKIKIEYKFVDEIKKIRVKVLLKIQKGAKSKDELQAIVEALKWIWLAWEKMRRWTKLTRLV